MGKSFSPSVYEAGKISLLSIMDVIVTLLHFNDCYNVEPQSTEPVGGAARFCTVVKSMSSLNPLILFSGDVLAPSIMSTFTKGDQMVPVLNSIRTDCAVYGNHDFDFGVDNLVDFKEKCEFPWLISNVIDNETHRLLADGLEYVIVERGGKKIGLIGLVEEEWLATLATIDPEQVEFRDFVAEGRRLAQLLKGPHHGCDYVIALTHMRYPNDCRLAENVDEIDLILGGHDHVYDVKKRGEKYIVKSGTDFRQLSKITLTFKAEGPVDTHIEEINVTSEYEEDQGLVEALKKYDEVVQGKMDEVLGHFSVELDGRFSSIRTSETNLGNFVTDVMLAATHSDLALLNSGTLRSDRVHPKGPFTMRDLVTVLPMMDSLIVVEVSGHQVVGALENGVSQYPKLEGRFPQVSGVSFAFDPQQPPGSRINPQHVKIGDEMLDMTQKYRLVTKMYLYQGKDGYDVLKNSPILMADDESPELCTAVQNHFQAIKLLTGAQDHPHTHHRQSLVALSRRHSVVRMAEEAHGHSHKQQSLSRGISLDASVRRNQFGARQPSLDNVEHEQARLSPKIEGRIVILTSEVKERLAEERKKQFIQPIHIKDVIAEEGPNITSFEEKS
ncbi:5' nucleotidase-like [Tropilaelaps mercedesae]|uniref:5' nucleotidase-like n=1 Tax=Tropilaelaps mercedesae TaxID=418985 RepID=A0A1V9X6R7_9ACAR|nr:5' nucleotidase-like [Tropilaelaps mercedesae]